MAELNVTKQTVGMDMRAPYGVYVNGQKVTVYADLKEAEKHYFSLAKHSQINAAVDMDAAQLEIAPKKTPWDGYQAPAH
ncbi:MAG: hypothetical protein KA207_02765 [Burkholderiaceae bacterium]|nr:hypothetical protein [Burkholderiaceae bacterium]